MKLISLSKKTSGIRDLFVKLASTDNTAYPSRLLSIRRAAYLQQVGKVTTEIKKARWS